MQLTLRRPLGPPVGRSSQQRSRRNAMVATTALDPAPGRARRGRGLPRGARPRPTTRQRSRRDGGGGSPPPADPGDTSPIRQALLRQNRRHGRLPRPARPAHARLAFDDVLSDDGTRLRAWTNDPDGTVDGPTVVLCNGLGTSPWAWPALLDPDCGVRVVSWNHRGTGGSDRPADPQPRRHRRVRRGRAVGDGPLRRRPRRPHGLVDGRQHDVRAGRPPTPSA